MGALCPNRRGRVRLFGGGIVALETVLMWYYMDHMLRISKLTDYAILAMVELTRDGEMLSAHALAERIGVEVPRVDPPKQTLDGSESG